MATKKNSKKQKTEPRSRVKASPITQRPTYAELRQQLAESAIENKRLFRDRETRNRELAALYEVATASSQSLELQCVLEAVMKKISEIFNFAAMEIGRA